MTAVHTLSDTDIRTMNKSINQIISQSVKVLLDPWGLESF